MQDLWTAVDEFIEGSLHASDPILASVLEAGKAAGLPQIQVSAPQAKLLQMLASLVRAERILEIGTLAGYSAIWLARALPPGGRLVTIERMPNHAAIAAANFERAGIADKVDLRVGRALDVLPQLEAEDIGPFDFTFIDADKPNNSDYLEWATRLSCSGGLIVLDNVVRRGEILAPGVDANAAGAHDAIQWLASHNELDSTVIQTVGAKGYDGFAIAVVD